MREKRWSGLWWSSGGGGWGWSFGGIGPAGDVARKKSGGQFTVIRRIRAQYRGQGTAGGVNTGWH